MKSRSNFWAVAGASYAAADGLWMPSYANLDLLMKDEYGQIDSPGKECPGQYKCISPA
jgi:hypothetical protein